MKIKVVLRMLFLIKSHIRINKNVYISIIIDSIKKKIAKKDSDKNFENYSNFQGLVPQKKHFLKLFNFFNIVPFYN